MIEILGYIFAVILGLLLFVMLLEIGICLCRAIDKTLWDLWLSGVSRKELISKYKKGILQLLWKNIKIQFKYGNGMSFSKGAYKWDGVGTGRDKTLSDYG